MQSFSDTSMREHGRKPPITDAKLSPFWLRLRGITAEIDIWGQRLGKFLLDAYLPPMLRILSPCRVKVKLLSFSSLRKSLEGLDT